MQGRGKGKDPHNIGYVAEPNKTFIDDLDPDYKLPALYGNGVLKRSNLTVAEQPSQEINDKIFLWRGDIETLAMTAIVNAADETLRSNRGVSGAIFARAGKDVQELEKQCENEAEVKPGDVASTEGNMGDLDCHIIIHAVGPDSRTTDSKTTSKGVAHMEDLLRSCYLDSLDELLKFTNSGTPAEIAFPAISTGDNGFEHNWATPIALSEVRNYLNIDVLGKRLDKILFCVFDDEAEDSYKHHIPIYFPPTTKDLQDAQGNPIETIRGGKGKERATEGRTAKRGGKGIAGGKRRAGGKSRAGGKCKAGRKGMVGGKGMGSRPGPASSGNAISFLGDPYATVLEAINHRWPTPTECVLRMRTWASWSINTTDEGQTDVDRRTLHDDGFVSYFPGLSRPGRRV